MLALDLAQGVTLVDYILIAFMGMNVMLSGSFLIHRGVRRLRAVR